MIPIIQRQYLQELRDTAKGMAHGNLNPDWVRAYLDIADAADRLDAMEARCAVTPDGTCKTEVPQDVKQESYDSRASNELSGTSMEMPKYRSHKTVWAMKITGIEPQAADGTAGLLCETPDGQPSRIIVTQEYQQKHAPAFGGYYVRYADGYESFSPAQAFEEGYTRI